jgi:hypothetical protein
MYSWCRNASYKLRRWVYRTLAGLRRREIACLRSRSTDILTVDMVSPFESQSKVRARIQYNSAHILMGLSEAYLRLASPFVRQGSRFVTLFPTWP